jgi:hypothetical protein
MNFSNNGSSFPIKKPLLIMKIIILLLVGVGIFPAYANSYAQETKLTIKESNIALDKLLKHIESKTDFYFFYSNDKIDKGKTVSVNAENKSIFDVLNQALSGTDIQYQVVDKAIILSKGALVAQQQGRTIRGTVNDTNGDPIIGANVVEKGTSNGVITDIDGNFTLVVGNNSTLLISFIGYVPQEITVGNRSSFAIALVEDMQALEESGNWIRYGQEKRPYRRSGQSRYVGLAKLS